MQTTVVELNQLHQQQGLFKIVLLTWESIEETLRQNPGLWGAAVDPPVKVAIEPIEQKVDAIGRGIDAIRAQISEDEREAMGGTPSSPVEEYLKEHLPDACSRWFRPDDRFAFHPRDQFVELSGHWDDQPENQPPDCDLTAGILTRLRNGQARLAVSANYGQGKTFLAWRLALLLGRMPDRSHIPFFFPLKEYNPNSHLRPLEQIQVHIERDLATPPLAELFDRERCLLILDGADEIPAGAGAILSRLRVLLDSLGRFPNLAILLAFRSGLFPGGQEQLHKELPGFRVATLIPWGKGGAGWRRLLELCEKTHYAHFQGGWAAFFKKVNQSSLLKDLTARPLWCRLIVETRDSILEQDIGDEADLYQFYIDWFFGRRAGGGQYLTIAQKIQVLELLARALARAGYTGYSGRPETVKITDDELRRAAAQTFRMLPDSAFTDYLTHEMRTYSLLDCHTLSSDRAVYSFGHNSFEEFFQARALLGLLDQAKEDLASYKDDLCVLCQRVLLSRDQLRFASGLLRRRPTSHLIPMLLRQKVRLLFGNISEEVNGIRQALLAIWLDYSRRILMSPQPDLSGFQLNGMTLREIDFSGCQFGRATLSCSYVISCDFTGVKDLSECNCRNTEFADCQRDGMYYQGPE